MKSLSLSIWINDLLHASLNAALLLEIKDIFDEKGKEDVMLLSLAAGKRQPIIPHLEFEYPDPDIHEDLYQLIKYSCGEVCTADQQDKTMKIWTAFLEPMLGVPSRRHGCENTKDFIKAKADIAKTVNNSDRERHCSPGCSVSLTDQKKSNSSGNGDEKVLPECSTSNNDGNRVKEEGSHDAANAPHKTDGLCDTPQHGMCNDGSVVDAISMVSKQVDSSEQLGSSIDGPKESLGRLNVENASGTDLN